MDVTLEQVVKYCSPQLDQYQRCVEKNPHDWHTNSLCLTLKKELTKCADENIKELREVKQKCNSSIVEYDQCLSKNAKEPEKCIEQLKALYYCTEAAAGRKFGVIDENKDKQ
ncbi:6250_t:CDS:2 [Ambispora gerdemannii]|uniref:6250_t:CDS:1 n=1 Tax=Ambispora gerdemannii TaxID=144530 RepID=A0A9N8VG20_9GLOM|nr:6250_t:CDS:2 [Ambispora gerdemannii]